MTRIRIRFSKIGKVRFTSHRDVARMWERALRREKVDLVYTQGFSPRPKIGFGLALPTSCESTAEYLDVWTNTEYQSVSGEGYEDSEVARLGARLGDLLPSGVDVIQCEVVGEVAASLQEEITSCSWVIDVPDLSLQEVGEKIEQVLRAPTLPIERERKGRQVTDDLRPSVLSIIGVSTETSGTTILAELGTRPRGVRPAELARVVGVSFGCARRTNQWIERDGSRTEPMTAGLKPELAMSSGSGSVS